MIKRLLLHLCLCAAACPLHAQTHDGPGLGVLDVVRSVIANNTNVQVQNRQAEISEGALRSATGQFDPRVQFSLTRSRDNSPLSLANRAALGQSFLSSDITTYRLSLDKRFRWGMTASPGLEYHRNDIQTIADAPTTNQARVNLRLTQPLLRGRGTVVTAAQMEIADLDYRAGQFDQRHAVSQEIVNGVTAYWTYVSAYKNLEILRESEDRAQALVNETQTLIDADEVPPAEITQLIANVADKAASRIRAEQNLIEARYSLGQTMGLPFEEIPRLPPPADPFPGVRSQQMSNLDRLASFIALGLQLRADFQAAALREQSAARLTEATRQNRLPDLNITFDMGYASLQEGNAFNRLFSPLVQDRTGLNVSATLSYDWPIPNNNAKGQLDQQAAFLEQRDIQVADLRRRISSNVTVAVNALRHRALELQHAQEAVRLYRAAIESEKQKFQLGMSTLLDVINLEDRLRAAMLNEVSSQLGYASALVQLRFETGTLVSSDRPALDVGWDEVTTVPPATP